MSATDAIFASDAVSWCLCKRKVWFDHHPPLRGTADVDAFAELIKLQGDAHEWNVLEQLIADGEVVEAESVEHTLELMALETPVIYQPVAEQQHPRIIAKPDFLIFRGDAGYQVADAKLARSLKNHKDIQVQLGLYRRLFATDLPALVYLGQGQIAEIGDDINDAVDDFIGEMTVLLKQSGPPQVRYSHSKCSACGWLDACLPEFEQADDLSLLYGVNGRVAELLAAEGIERISQLASLKPTDIPDIPYLKGEDKKQRAIWQAQAIINNEPRLVAPLELPEGTWVHFDLESNPLDPAGDQVYLWGLLEPPYNVGDFYYHWSDSADQDKRAWLSFLLHVQRLREHYSDLVLVHYAHFEVQKIRAYAERYQMLDDERVEWLLGEHSPLLDLSKVVQQSLVLPLKSYGLKAVCKSPVLVNFQWELEESGSQWSVVRYLDFQQARSELERISIKNEILSYNRDDVRATRALELWLKGLHRGDHK